METYKTQDGRDTLIFYSLGNFLSNQSRGYVDGLNPDSNGDPRDEMIGLFAAVKRDYGQRACVWNWGTWACFRCGRKQPQRNGRGREKKTVIKPVLIDREIPPAQTRLDELNKAAQGSAGLADDQKNEFIEVTKRLKLLTDRRAQILARVGDDYVMAPPKLQSKP